MDRPGRLRKARIRAHKLLAEAKRERGSTGYRENLGYDQYQALEDYCKELCLSYTETSMILGNFENACDDL